ncbi:MAG: flavodoxin family protein [Desulfovibrio sp.]|nr:MAG: flavodoxin family protein [Desulfovibrio sp.]
MVLSSSPRSGGNSDLAAELFARGIERAGGQCRVLHLRDFVVRPCIGCHFCARDEQSRCILSPDTGKEKDSDDQTDEVFSLLSQARFIALSAPIYFYHLPAGFKALIDRAQRFYAAREKGVAPPRKAGTGYSILVAGRTRGEQLFAGSVLTLKYFLEPQGFSMAEPLLLRGLDAQSDLKQSPEASAQVEEYGHMAWVSSLR